MNEKIDVGIHLGEDEQRRLDNFLCDLDLFLGETIKGKLGDLYHSFRRLQDHKDNVNAGCDWFPEEYVDFLNELSFARDLSNLPYSIEADNAGLPSDEDYNQAIAAALLKAGAKKAAADFLKFCHNFNC